MTYSNNIDGKSLDKIACWEKDSETSLIGRHTKEKIRPILTFLNNFIALLLFFFFFLVMAILDSAWGQLHKRPTHST